MARSQLPQRREDSVHSIDQALSSLEDATKEGTEDIREILSKDYTRLKNVLNAVAPDVRRALSIAKDRSVESIRKSKDKVVIAGRETAQKLDHEVHAHPWQYVGAAALISGVMGYLLARKQNR